MPQHRYITGTPYDLPSLVSPIAYPGGAHAERKHRGERKTVYAAEVPGDLPTVCPGQHCLGRRWAVFHRGGRIPAHVGPSPKPLVPSWDTLIRDMAEKAGLPVRDVPLHARRSLDALLDPPCGCLSCSLPMDDDDLDIYDD